MLRKKVRGVAKGPRLASSVNERGNATIDRRSFLRNSGLAVGGLTAAATATGGRVRRAEAADKAPDGKVEIKKSVCTHCSVGCTVLAEVQGGVWVGQELSLIHI